MKLVILLLVFVLIFLENIRYEVTIFLTILWAIYTIYQIIRLFILKDKKIVTNAILEYPPNDNYASHIRYLYKRRVDSKSFISTILELILKDSISLKRNNSEYYFIDNKVPYEALTKNEDNVKKILFREMGNTESVSLLEIKNACRKNAGYISTVLKDWALTCEYECIKDKYFKSIKKVIEDYIFYFVISLIIAVYNVLITKLLIVAVVIFLMTSILSIVANNFKKMSEDAIPEYKNWLEFRNYLNRGNLSDLDNNILERYAIYAYVLDAYKPFKYSLFDKYMKDKEIFNNSVILSIINASIFDDIEKVIRKSINKVKVRSYIYVKNKGRR